MQQQTMQPAVALQRANGQPSDKYCQCASCGEAFTTVALFDRHRVGKYAKPGQLKGTRRCLSAAEMAGKGWAQNQRGFWKGTALSSAQLERLQSSMRPRRTESPAFA